MRELHPDIAHTAKEMIIKEFQKTGLSYKFFQYIKSQVDENIRSISLVSLPNAISFWKRNNFMSYKIEKHILDSYGNDAEYLLDIINNNKKIFVSVNRSHI